MPSSAALLVRGGSQGPMEHGWQIPPAFVEKSHDRIRAAAPKGVPGTIARVTRRGKPRATVLPQSDIDATPEEGVPADEHGDPA